DDFVTATGWGLRLVQHLLQRFWPASLFGPIGIRVTIAQDTEDVRRFGYDHNRALEPFRIIGGTSHRLPEHYRVRFAQVIPCDVVYAPIVGSFDPHRLHRSPVVHDTKSNKDTSCRF